MSSKVLMLGAGLVAEPIVRYLLDCPDIRLTLCDLTVDRALKLVDGHPRGTVRALDINNETELEQGVREHDLSISLLPALLHPIVAKYCLKHSKHLVTSSYVSPVMRSFDEEAKARNILFLNEVGLDPGIDHMSAKRVFDEIDRRGGRITGFRSYCGGLPAPEANTNPFGYKFSWAPRGVILAARNAAKYLWQGKLCEIPGEELFRHFHYLTVDGMEFEAYPNRDSMPYQELYGLRDIHTMFRGTFRYKGWCVTLKALVDLGFLDMTERVFKAANYEELMRERIDAPVGNLREAMASRSGLPVDHPAIDNITWLGLTSRQPLPRNVNNALDFLVHLCLLKLQFQPGERDMVVLHHIFDAEFAGTARTITSTLIDYGIPNGQTAMARTVSLPAAIATRLILQNKISLRGVQIPVHPEIYNPILDELATLGITCKESGI